MGSAGGDNKVQVELAKYEPNIKCDTSSKPGPPWLSCVTVFSNMRASKQYRVFGSYDQPNIEEGLPLVLEAGGYKRNTFSHLHGKAEHLLCQATADAKSRSPSPATHPRSQVGTRSGPPWPPSRACARVGKQRAARPVGSVSVPIQLGSGQGLYLLIGRYEKVRIRISSSSCPTRLPLRLPLWDGY